MGHYLLSPAISNDIPLLIKRKISSQYFLYLILDIHTMKEHPGKGPSHSIIPLAVAVTLIVIPAISTLSFCIYKHNSGIFRRLAQFGNPYYPATNFSTVHLEENILTSDVEENDQ